MQTRLSERSKLEMRLFWPHGPERRVAAAKAAMNKEAGRHV